MTYASARANKKPIYLDYMATTPADPRVIDLMLSYLGSDSNFGNPSSLSHDYGLQASQAVELARAEIAESIGARAEALVFTSGATEADNLAIIGAANFYKRKGKHVITMMTEHRAVIDSFKHLEREGFAVTYLKPNPDGLLDLNLLLRALRPDTILVSIMHVNNVTGVIQDIAALGQILADKGIVFHVDAAQSAGKLPIDLRTLPVDLMSFSAHKNYGPKGIGALYIRQKPRIRLEPLTFGGGQERGLRAGTLATHQIVGMGRAFAISAQGIEAEQARIFQLRQQLWEGIRTLPKVRLNGHETQRIAGSLNVCFAGLSPDSLLLALRELAISRTSACASLSTEPSYVLKAMGLSDADANSSVRFAIGRFTTEEDVKAAIEIILFQVKQLQEMLPL